MPSIAPSVVAKSGTVVRLLTRATTLAPMPTPTTATPMDRPMASTEPKAKMRITIANARPISSDAGGCAVASAWPASSMSIAAFFGNCSWIRTPSSASSR